MKLRVRIIKMFGINICGTWLQYNEPIICYRQVIGGKLSNSYYYDMDIMIKTIQRHHARLN